MYVYICVYAHTLVYKPSASDAKGNIHMCIYIYLYVYMYICTCIYIYTYMRTLAATNPRTHDAKVDIYM